MARRTVHVSLVGSALLVFAAACAQWNPTDATSCDQFGVGCTPDELQSQLVSTRDWLAAAQADGGGETYRNIVNPALLQCQEQSFTGSATVMGPSGGELAFGPHKITFPPGALSNDVVVSGQLHVASHVVVELFPHGLQMSVPAIIELAYGYCQSGGGGFEVAYVDDELNIISFPAAPSGGAISGKTKGQLWHFSKYAVAY